MQEVYRKLCSVCDVLYGGFPEELSDVKGQVKMVEDKNTSYMQTNMELEEV